MNDAISTDGLDTAFLSGGGELGALMRTNDWSKTPLGEPASWPRSLKTVVRIMLTSRQPIWIGWGPELTYLYNDPYKSIIGGKHPNVLGLPTSVVWREIWRDIEPLLASAMNGDGTFVESQLLIMERNGYPEETYYTFSYSPIPGDDGRPAGIICANSDETRRVVGERQLALLRDLAASSTDAKTVDEAVRRCVAAMRGNPRDITFGFAYVRKRGDAPLQLVGRLDGNASSPERSRINACDGLWSAEDALRERRPRVVDLPSDVAWPAGSWDTSSRRAMVLPLSPASDAGHEGVLVLGLNPYRLVDDDYRGFLELVAQQLETAIGGAEAFEAERRRAEELAELDRAKTTFFSNVSHEFRTPLTLMRGPITDVLVDPELPPRLREQVKLVERNSLRLSRLVNALLEFSRIEAGRLQSVFRATDLARLTTELASIFRSAMERAGLDYEVACDPLPEPVYVDRDQWERIVLNLLSNALKFTLAGRVSLRLQAEGRSAVMEVEDTGVGVPEHELGRLFERFHRVQGTHGRTHEGSGIGLAFVQELVRLHGGSIAAQSRLGAGTAFTVRIPFGHAHLPSEQIATSGGGELPSGGAEAFVQEALRWLPDSGVDAELAPSSEAAVVGERYRTSVGARVVVADDNADLRLYLTRLLEPYYEVEAVENGEEALAAARRKRPALVISDVMMPKLDGFGLVAALRSERGLRGVPIVLLSARAGEEARVEGLEKGADDYLVKPFTARELLARVSAIIELDRVRRASEQQLNLFLASNQLFSWDVDIATGRIALSENAAEVLGRPPHSLGEALTFVHPEDEPRHRRLLEQAVAEGGQYTDEIRIIRGDDGTTRWMLVRARCVLDEQGRAVRLTGLTFDITERKTMELALRESDRRKDEFLAMLAHELRNPMAPIRNAAETLKHMPTVDASTGKAVNIINRQVQQLARLVDDLLDVSRITTGRIQLESKPVDLSSVVRAAVEASESLIRERAHALDVVTGLPMTVMGDAARLQQCVVNLLTNSAKYTEPGGRLMVELVGDGDAGVIRVSDNGAGISAEFVPFVFDLFVQSDRTLDRSQGGLGIGLSVVKRLAEMHGGSVSARSAGLGKGSTFEIRLPLTKGRAEMADPRRSDTANPPLRILVVDDNRDAADALAVVLSCEGHEVRTVYSAHDAHLTALSWKPEAMLLDIGLPDVDGYSLGRRLRQESTLGGMFLVALTGYGQPADRDRARDAGFDEHIVKPADVSHVLSVLRQARG